MRPFYINGSTLVAKELYGIQRNTIALLNELDPMIGKGEIIILVPESSDKDFGFRNITVQKVNTADLGVFFSFRKYCRKHHGFILDPTLTLSLLGCDILFYYDCIFERIKQNFNTPKKKLSRLKHIIAAYINLKRAKTIITISNYSKNDIVSYYHVKPEKIDIIYVSWEHFDEIVPDTGVYQKFGLEKGRYCFSIGSRAYHKNFRWVLAAAKQNPQYKFVVSGTNILSSSDSSLDDDKPENLIFTGYITDSEVKALMSGCKVLIQPSIYEGAGMPPMEAMSTGAKCIVANATALPEIYGNSVWYIDPLDYDNIDIDKIMSTETEDSSKVLERYSWKRSAEKLYEIIADFRKKYDKQIGTDI